MYITFEFDILKDQSGRSTCVPCDMGSFVNETAFTVCFDCAKRVNTKKVRSKLRACRIICEQDSSISQPALFVQLVTCTCMLRQKLVARAVQQVPTRKISGSERKTHLRFHAMWDHLRTRQLSRSASTALLVSPYKHKVAAPHTQQLQQVCVPGKFKTRVSKRQTNHVM